MPETIQQYLPYIVIVNFFLVSLVLLILGKMAASRPLKELPDGAQNAAELVLDWFVNKAKEIHPQGVTIIAPFLASLFLFILFSNLLILLPVPIIKIPPTTYYSGPLTFALMAVLGSFILSAKFKGIFATFKHLFWPNPLQLISEFSHILSLSLRLYGNIGGEFMVVLLVMQAAPFGIPLIIHTLCLIPAFIQPIVFTLLTASFLATAIPAEGKAGKASEEG